jgi:hypothetical protein
MGDDANSMPPQAHTNALHYHTYDTGLSLVRTSRPALPVCLGFYPVLIISRDPPRQHTHPPSC